MWSSREPSALLSYRERRSSRHVRALDIGRIPDPDPERRHRPPLPPADLARRDAAGRPARAEGLPDERPRALARALQDVSARAAGRLAAARMAGEGRPARPSGPRAPAAPPR